MKRKPILCAPQRAGKPVAPSDVREHDHVVVRSVDLQLMDITPSEIGLIMRGRRVLDGETAADRWSAMAEEGAA
jgi:hypothetical protein